MEIEFLSILFGDEAVNNAMTFTFSLAIIGFFGLCIYSWISSLWENHVKKHGLYVTAADFNGKTWDVFPLKSLDESRFKENITWMITALKKPRIVCLQQETDYTVWDVLTWNGIKRAMPGDVISKTIFGYKVIKNFNQNNIFMN